MRHKLVRLRKQAGFTQYTFADRINISRNHYGQIETGAKNPSLELSLKIKNALAYHDDDIYFNTSRPETGQFFGERD